MGAIIFDFDGTIANSFDYVVNFLAEEAGRGPLSAEEKAELHNMSMLTIARRLGHPWWRLPRLFLKGRLMMNNAIKYVEPFAGIEDVIKKCHNEGHELYIVSSNIVRNLHDFLYRHKLQKYFLEIYGGAGLFGKSSVLRRLLKEQNLEVNKCMYVGDETRDIEAARAVGMRAVAVGWGFARVKDLHQEHPFKFAATPTELMNILEQT